MKNERIVSIDILRGFAMLGIVLINFHEMNFLPGSTTVFENNQLSKLVQTLFFNRTYLIFAFLFGYNLHIFKQATLKYNNYFSNRIIYQRLLAILVLGLIQTIVLWWGTILILYSMYGFMIYLIVKKISFMVKICLSLTIIFLIPILINYLDLKFHKVNLNIPILPAFDVDNFRAYCINGNLLQIMKLNLQAWLYEYFGVAGGNISLYQLLYSISYNCQIFGLILFGYSLSEKNVIQNLTYSNNFLFLSLCFTIYLFVKYANINLFQMDLIFIENLFFAFSIILIIIFIHKTKLSFIIQPFSIVGKTAFSFYVLHMICSYIVFYVMHQYQKYSFFQVELLAFGTFCFLFVAMFLLLRKTEYGLFEIILRKCTYFKIPRDEAI